MSRRDSVANAERIVEALRHLWTQDATPSLERVAKTAGVGVATLYRHFPNRAALESAAFSRIFAEEIGPIIESGGDDDLLTVAGDFVEAIGRYAPLFESMGVDQAADDSMEDVGESFVDLLRRGQQAGVLRPDLEPADLFWLLRMLVLGLTGPLSSERIRRRYLAMLLPAVETGASPLPPLEVQDYDRMGVPPHHRFPQV